MGRPKLLLVFTNLGGIMPLPIFPQEFGALSAWLKRHGYEPRVHTINSRAEIRRFPEVLSGYAPDAVGFTGVYSEWPHVSRLAAMVKAWRDVPVIVGGKHATLVPETVIADPNVDGVCVGEGEGALLDYVRALENGTDRLGIENFWWKNGGEVVRNPCREFIADLDSLPFLDDGVTDMQGVINAWHGVLQILAGRGTCEAKCAFCGVPPQAHKGKGKFSRRKSVEHLVREVEYLKGKYRFDYVYFRDDHFTGDRAWFLDFADRWAERIGLPYEILTRADTIDDEVLEALRRSACECVWLGADSGNLFIRSTVAEKTVPPDLLVEKAHALQRLGIKVLVTNIVGFPYETAEHFRDTIEVNRRVYAGTPTVSRMFGLVPAIFVFCPFPGTPLHKVCEKEGWLLPMPDDHVAYATSYVRMPQFSAFQIRARKVMFRFLVYVKTNPFWAAWCLLKDVVSDMSVHGLFPVRRFRSRLPY